MGHTGSSVTIVVPMFNEASRLDLHCFRAFHGAHPEVHFLFVDDGSWDGTGDLVRGFLKSYPTAAAKGMALLSLGRNVGKAEAVRLGVLAALEGQPAMVGYWDADLATPLAAIPSYLEVFARHPAVEVVMGARIKLLGRDIQRRLMRHYVGRVFATFASMVLSIAVYDTQCGAKILRATPRTRALFARPFLSRWVFDVELIARLLTAPGLQASADQLIFELPLLSWRDVAGSKVNLAAYGRAALDLGKIFWRYHGRCRASRRADDFRAGRAAGRPKPELG